jgi:FlaA1/EpsC-like NDP-sugar epimerase/lipopolysaccharide/colanic/teichoic acid biosynthesis glycosyltransferase
MVSHPLERLLAAAALLLVSPILAVAAVAIRASSPGPILYRARRVGYDGREFTLFKLRTMHVATGGGSAITARDDHRVFTAGGWLRRLKIDELPQLFNILRGEMAFVGPRPEDPAIVQAHYSAADRITLTVLPGLASPGSLYNYTHGEAVLADGDAEARYLREVLPTKLALDAHYVRHASFLYDCRIAGRTIAVILGTLVGRRRFAAPPEMRRVMQPDSSKNTLVMSIPVSVRRSAIVVLHLALMALCNYAAFWLRFDGRIPEREMELLRQSLPWLLVIRGVMFVPFRLYGGLWRYAGIWDLRNIVAAVFLSSALFYVLIALVLEIAAYPRSVFIIDAVLLLVGTGGLRLVSRMVPRAPSKRGRRVLIYGAGDAGEMIARDMKRHDDYWPVGFVDDDPAKRGHRIHGVRVLGTRHDLAQIIEREQPEEILVAVPRADPATMRNLLQALRQFRVRLTTLPNLQDLVDGTAQVSQIRELSIQDLLARAPVGLELSRVTELIGGKRVMVTGAGGSIGSEICRQLAALQPSSLVLFERYENGLYTVTNDVVEKLGFARVHPVIGDVTDDVRLNCVMAQHRPQIIFHAAAHKHVPLMESNACEAVKNNVTGTRLLLEAAERYGIERFVLISTDKAVNPSSIMGATKRVAELMVQSMSQLQHSRFVAVRFGNVLGSSGSVVPRFLDQINNGGPVTVTHPDMRRYFMMIPEAVQLVLQAAAIGESGDLYVLDMGEQIPLVELARNLIRLAGFVPDEEVKITFTGVRPGEKLSESLASEDEALEPSKVEKVMRVRSSGAVNPAMLSYRVSELEDAAARGDANAVLQCLYDLLPTYEPVDADGRRLTPARRAPRRVPVMVRRRFSHRTGLEYTQVIMDRRDPSRPTRRALFRGGRRASDVAGPSLPPPQGSESAPIDHVK